jgi:hypothetical protein
MKIDKTFFPGTFGGIFRYMLKSAKGSVYHEEVQSYRIHRSFRYNHWIFDRKQYDDE